jgi:hypothetical protein
VLAWRLSLSATNVQVKGSFVTPDCKTCLKNRRDGRVVPVCPECRKVYGLDHARAAVQPHLYAPVQEPEMDSPERDAARGYPLGRSIARFVGRLLISAAILAVAVLVLVYIGAQGGGGEDLLAALKISLILLPLWIFAGLLPSLADWAKNPLLAISTTFGPPAFVLYKVVPTLF